MGKYLNLDESPTEESEKRKSPAYGVYEMRRREATYLEPARKDVISGGVLYSRADGSPLARIGKDGTLKEIQVSI